MNIQDFEIVSFLKEDEKYISGKELEKRALALGGWATKEDVEWLLEHQDEMPEEWRDYYLVSNWQHLMRNKHLATDGRIVKEISQAEFDYFQMHCWPFGWVIIC